MQELDAQDEQVKKKKRRVLAGLFFMLLGTLTLVPLARHFLPSATAVSEAATETPASAPTDTLTPDAATATAPQATETAAVPSEPPPASAATEEPLDGAGGGEVDVTPSPTGPPVPASPLGSPTPSDPVQLPVTGASGVYGLVWLALGLAAWLIGVILLRSGLSPPAERPARR